MQLCNKWNKANFLIANSMASSLRKAVSQRINIVRLGAAHVEKNTCFRSISSSILAAASSQDGEGTILDFPDMGPPIPEYQSRKNETIDQKRARLFYQSR